MKPMSQQINFIFIKCVNYILNKKSN